MEGWFHLSAYFFVLLHAFNRLDEWYVGLLSMVSSFIPSWILVSKFSGTTDRYTVV